MDLTKEVRDHGLILEPIVEEDHYVLRGYGAEKLGGVEQTIMPDGHGWRKFKPKSEIQKQYGLETMNCTVFGTLNALETLANFYKFDDFPKDCSERYIGVLAGTSRDGNEPHKVIETIRTFAGVIENRLLAWTRDITEWDQYYAPNPMLENLVATGQKILRAFIIRHAWVFNGFGVKNKQGKLISALMIGTVCVSTLAWKKKNGRYWKNVDELDNHWCQLLDYKQGEYWIVFDHYDETEKKLDWDYDFCAAKVYFLERNPNPQDWKPFGGDNSFFTLVFAGIKRLINRIWGSSK